MKIRLTSIALRLSADQDFAIGEELIVGEDIPAELAQRRLDANTAELVVDGEAVSPELSLAMAALDTHGRGLAEASLALLALGEAGDDSAVIAIANAFKAQFEVMTSQLTYDVNSRLDSLYQRAAEASQSIALTLTSAGSADGQEPDDQAQQVSGSTNSAGSAGASAPGNNDPSETADAAASTDGAAAGNAAASDDNPAQTGGVLGAAAEASAPAAKPKKPAKAKPAATSGGGA